MADKQVSDFTPGQIVLFCTLDRGPSMAVLGPTPEGDKVECGYFNEVTGKFETVAFTPNLLVNAH